MNKYDCRMYIYGYEDGIQGYETGVHSHGGHPMYIQGRADGLHDLSDMTEEDVKLKLEELLEMFENYLDYDKIS